MAMRVMIGALLISAFIGKVHPVTILNTKGGVSDPAGKRAVVAYS